MLKEPLTVLLTGFGPFPGVPFNATQDLIPMIASAAAWHRSDIDVVWEILPTDWSAAPARVRDIIRDVRPQCILHFGVSRHVSSLVVERCARNECSGEPDAAGSCQTNGVVRVGGPPVRIATIPVNAIVDRLKTLGVPSETSDDAGVYICNAVFYQSLDACQARTSAKVGFVHLPEHLSYRDGSLTWEQAVSGAVELISICVDATKAHREKSQVAVA